MTKITTSSVAGINLIKKFESFKSKPYICPAGVPTIGYGNTFYENGVKVKMTDPAITEQRADQLLRFILKTFEQSVDSFCRDDVNQYQFDALSSFAYNCGVQNLKTSTLLKKVNVNPNDPTIKDSFMKWVFGGDGTHNRVDDDGDGLVDEAGERQKLKGLLNRRTAEAELYFKK